MGNEVIKKGEGKLTHAVTINVDRDYKSKYDTLTNEKRVRVAEHLRRVIYPEIDRLIALEAGPDPAA